MKRFGRKFRLGDMTFGIAAWLGEEDHGVNMMISHRGWYFRNVPIDVPVEKIMMLVEDFGLEEIDVRQMWLAPTELEYKHRDNYSIYIGDEYMFSVGAQNLDDVMESLKNPKIDYDLIRVIHPSSHKNVFDGIINKVSTKIYDPIDDFMVRYEGTATVTIDVPIAVHRYGITDPIHREAIIRRQILQQLKSIVEDGTVISHEDLDISYDQT